ncbi:MAG: hypothetical protein JWN70_3663 [Planctomycetaceae bacterium]|nr:hypothetical protein [Planctomycetaceae bacterium]
MGEPPQSKASNRVPQISTASTSDLHRALALLLGGAVREEQTAQVDALLAAINRGEVSPDGLQVARTQNAIVGAVLAVCQPGGTAHVWPPRLVPNEPLETAHALAISCCQWVAASGAKMAQCLTQLEDHASQQILEQAGFEHLTDLACWQHTLEEIPHAVLPDDCDIVEYSPENTADFERVMQATYIDSQDCAALHNRRSARDSLTSHELVANAESRHWLLYRCGDEDVGVVLCADHRDQQMWELLYMGVVPKFRQQGFGLAMVCEALWDAQESGAEGLFLAADDANEAAAKLYDACGFSIGFRQRIHVWFPPADAR